MRILSVFLAVAFVACGGTTKGGPSPENDAGDPSTTGAGGHSGSGSPTGATAAGDAGTLVLQAFGGPSGSVAAQIPLLEPGVGQDETCASPQVAGACKLVSCSLGGIGDPGGEYGDFGPISASVGATSVPITYNGTGYGTVYFPAGVVLGTGGTMTFKGGNWGGFAAFDVAATIPGLAVITAPIPTTDGGTAIVDTSHDLTVNWTPISIGTIDFELQGGGGEGPGGTAISIACSFNGSAGSGTVPQALLSSMKGMAGSSPVYADIDSELVVSSVVGGLNIVMQSYQSSPSVPSSFGVTLQ